MPASPTKIPAAKSRRLAIALAVFFGWFGLHHFYLGKNRRGLIYLVFFWTYIPLAISLIEALIWAFQGDEAFLLKTQPELAALHGSSAAPAASVNPLGAAAGPSQLAMSSTTSATASKPAGRFEIEEASDGQFFFRLIDAVGDIVLRSELYQAKAGALNGIKSVRRNAGNDRLYDRRTSSADQPYFVLQAANHQVIGTSEMFSSVALMAEGIAAVKRDGPDAILVDLTSTASKPVAEPAAFAAPTTPTMAPTAPATRATSKPSQAARVGTGLAGATPSTRRLWRSMGRTGKGCLSLIVVSAAGLVALIANTDFPPSESATVTLATEASLRSEEPTDEPTELTATEVATEVPTETPEPTTEPPTSTPPPTEIPIPTVPPTPMPAPTDPPPPSTEAPPPPPPPPPPNPYFTNGQDLYNCGDFGSWAEAKAALEANRPGDPNDLDRDNDGIPCESLPGAP